MRVGWLSYVGGWLGGRGVGDGMGLPISDVNSLSSLVLLPGLFVAKSHFSEIEKGLLETFALKINAQKRNLFLNEIKVPTRENT